MRTKTVIKSIFPSVVHAKKLNKYEEAQWKDADQRDLSIPDDAVIYFKEDNHFLWSVCSYFVEYKNGKVKGFWL